MAPNPIYLTFMSYYHLTLNCKELKVKELYLQRTASWILTPQRVFPVEQLEEHWEELSSRTAHSILSGLLDRETSLQNRTLFIEIQNEDENYFGYIDV